MAGRKNNRQGKSDYSGIVGGVLIIILIFLGIVLGPKIFNYYKGAVSQADSTAVSEKQKKDKGKKKKTDGGLKNADEISTDLNEKASIDSDNKESKTGSGKKDQTTVKSAETDTPDVTGEDDLENKVDSSASDKEDQANSIKETETEINTNGEGYSNTDFEDPAVREILMTRAGETVDVSRLSEEGIANCFCYTPITDDVFARIKGKSYKDDCTVPRDELRYVKILHYGFDGNVHVGELIVNRKIADDVIYIFSSLFDEKYPIEKILLVDEFDADDNKSMAANNSSSFNFRTVENSDSLSLHSYGLAIDINTLYNPYVVPKKDGTTAVYPVEGTAYADRSLNCIYYIRPDDICVRLFKECGFTWGGDWTSVKDYQHFEKTILIY